MIRLETQRLTLRQWQPQDFPMFEAFYADERQAKYVGGVKTLDEAWRHFAMLIGHWQLLGFGYWAVEENTSGNFVGSVGLWHSAGWPELELGYWLLPDYHGKGYAKEAALAAKEYAQSTLKADSLVSYIDPTNEPSIRLAQALGARYDGTIELLKHGPHQVYRHI